MQTGLTIDFCFDIISFENGKKTASESKRNHNVKYNGFYKTQIRADE